MDYSIYKDENVQLTVDKIKNILSNIGIRLEETIFEYPTDKNRLPGYSKYPSDCPFLPYSSRVSFPNLFGIGTNGKGTTEENCRASAYSEFMERLQNQALPNNFLALCSDKFFLAPDEKEYDKKTDDFISKYNYTKLFFSGQLEKVNNIPMKKVVVPYFNIKDNKLHYLPHLYFTFTSNGMAAGNTPEEALVQGFSEICERYVHKCIIVDKILMPELPKKYYEKYERLNGLIDYTEKLGWKVSVKDASLGKGMPVICTTFENEEKDLFGYRLASHPSLTVAIERTLTEFFQGGLMNNHDILNKILHIEDYSKKGLKYAFAPLNTERWYFRCSEKLHTKFFNKNADYKPSVDSWINEDKKYTNKELLKFLVDKITNVTNNDIYIRDVSFLGFPSYHIFIPEFSETRFFVEDIANLYRWSTYSSEYKDPSYNIDSLISAMLYRLQYAPRNRTVAPLVPDEYLLVLCYILKNDIKNILKYCEILKKTAEQEFAPEFLLENKELINIISHYYGLKQQNERSAMIQNIINNMYNQNDIQKFNSLIKDLDFEYIKNFVSEAVEKENIREQAESQKKLNTANDIVNIKEKMIKVYIENTPDQMKLKKVFDFSEG